MSCETYKEIKFKQASLDLIAVMNAIIDEYLKAGYKLTVRQLYYQLVAKALIENTEQSYNRVTSIANDARIAGLMDWDAIEDRTREFVRTQRWEDGAQILAAASKSFHMDMWKTQDTRAFVIIEKEALVGILEATCRSLDVPILAARGYPSASVLREFTVEDVNEAINNEQTVSILHLGDHDPSGIDMTRDLTDRIQLFAYGSSMIDLQRIALNRDQIDQQNPPPNPAKVTDSRFAAYQALHGNESWELDALRPDYLNKLVRKRITALIDHEKWTERHELVENIKRRIEELAEGFDVDAT